MKRLVFIVLIFLYVFSIKPAHALSRQELINLSKKVQADDARREAARKYANRVERVRGYLASKGSPLARDAKSFVDCADNFGLHPGLLVGITAAESTYGRFYSLANNPYNFGVHLGLSFPNMAAASCHVAQRLATNYDTRTPLSIGVRYAPAEDHNNPRHWASVVQSVIDDLKDI